MAFKHVIFLLVTYFLILGTGIRAWSADSIEIAVSAEAPIINGEISTARKKAIDKCLNEAVERGVGIYVDRRTMVSKGRLIKDRIFRRSSGSIASYDIIDEKNLGTSFFVAVNAFVSLQSIKTDLAAIGILREEMDYPRLMISIGSSKTVPDEVMRSTGELLKKLFVEKHFEVIDADLGVKMNHDFAPLSKETSMKSAFISKALKEGIEIAIIAHLSSQRKTKTNAGLFVSHPTLSLRGFDTASRQLLFTIEERGTGIGFSYEDSLSAGTEKSSKKASEYAVKEIIRWWNELRENGTLYKVVLKDTNDDRQAALFEGTIKGIPGVMSVIERRFGGGDLECDVRFAGTKSEFEQATRGRSKDISGLKNLRVILSTGNFIVFVPEASKKDLEDNSETETDLIM